VLRCCDAVCMAMVVAQRAHVVMQIDRNVEREVIVHSTMRHPNIIGFKKVSDRTWDLRAAVYG
jgi:hypothetical protein